MNKFLTLNDSQRKNVYESISHKVNLPAQVVEKDFWVTAVLQTVFSLPIAEHLVFKGGTSLSKGWKLIERFSEDIDLAVDPVFLGANEGDLTKKQIKKLRKVSSLFVLEQLTPMIRERIADVGLQSFITLEAQPNGEGDNTYPEPRHRMQLVPREDIIDVWRNDYEAMKESMIYGKRPTFEELVVSLSELQARFRSVIIQ